MNFAHSVRVRVGILLVVFFSLLSSYQLLVQWVQTDLSFIGLDDITLNEKRFDRIKESLPSHGVVGYWPNGIPTTFEQLQFGNAVDLQNWFLTQYALAPVIVSPTLGHRLIISNSHTTPGIVNPGLDLPGGKPTIKETVDGRKVLDFGNGVKLIKRELK